MEQTAPSPTDFGPDLAVPVMQFEEYSCAEFSAECAVEGGDLIFHFFPPSTGWPKHFPQALDSVAQEHFSAGAERLAAQYITDYSLDSWWFRARGYVFDLLDPEAFVQSFYKKLAQRCLS